MSKVLLVFANAECGYGIPKYPGLAFAILSNVLKQKGHVVEVIDQRINKHPIQKAIDDFQPDYIGFHVTVLNIEITLELNRNLKLPLYCITMVGGPHPSFCPEEFKDFDYIVVGDGEKAIIEIVEGRAQQQTISMPVDDINFLPDWSVYKNYNFKQLPLFITRGCPYQCIFCAVNKIFGRIYRKRKLYNVIEEIKRGMDLGVRYFDIVDDCFTLDKNYVKEFCKLVKPLNIRWDPTQGVRIDTLDFETMRVMYDSGCRMFGVGIESGVQKIVDNIGKNLNLKIVKKKIAEAHKAGIKIKGFFVIGSPGETFEDVKRSIGFFKEADVDVPRFGMLAPYKGTPIYEWAKQNGHILVDESSKLTHGLHYETIRPGFDTDTFPADKRIEAFKLAERESQIWAIEKKIGWIGRLFRWDWLRNMAISVIQNNCYLKRIIWD